MSFQTVLSPTGEQLYLGPHIYHQLIDKSGVELPVVGFTGIGMYVPAFTEKGPNNEIRVFNGSTAYGDLIKTYGSPNAKKYGLPFSGAAYHASLGGTVIIQSIKPKGATHGAVIILMKVKKSNTKQKIGWVFDASLSGENLITGESGGLIEHEGNLYPSDLFIPGTSPGDVNNAIEPIKEQFISDTSTDTTLKMFRNVNIPGYVSEDIIEIMRKNGLTSAAEQAETKNRQLETAFAKYKKRWKPVYVDPIEIYFEAVDINKLRDSLLKNASTSDAITRVPTGVTSWDTLEVMVQNSTDATKTIEHVIEQAKAGGEFEYAIPIMWGYCKGKGKYGNNYIIDFQNTKSAVEGRPLLRCRLLDKKTGLVLPNSEKAVSFSNDFVNGTGVLIDSAYAEYNFGGDFKFATANTDTFNEMGELLEVYLGRAFNKKGEFHFTALDPLTNTYKTVAPFLKGNTSYGVDGDTIIDKMKNRLESLAEPEDSSLHRLSYVDFTRVTDTVGFVKSEGITTYSFSGGHEGELRYMKEFDWDFNFADPKLNKKYAHDPEFLRYKTEYGDRKIIQETFIEAFEGTLNPEIRSIFANPAKYIVDFGYPKAVKTAMFNFGAGHRDDIQMLFNTDVNNITGTESLADMKQYPFTTRNVSWYPGNFEWVDPFSNRSIRVPQTFVMIPNLLTHFNNGFSQALAGIQRGGLKGIIPGSGRGYGSMSLEENDKLYANGLNIMSIYQNGVVYMDSQLCNYKTGEEISSLQEFHNNSIINEILKNLYTKLQHYKHILANDSAADKVQEIINIDLAKYKAKVGSFSYSCKFKSTYDKAVGLLTHSLDVQFNNTIKTHKIVLTALPIK